MLEDSLGLGDIIVQCLIILSGHDEESCLSTVIFKAHLSNQNANIQQNMEKLQMSA
jgi:hypothetical protein